jgi:zinc ribbon protein
MQRCQTCGAELEAGANFCGHCGSAIIITTPAIPQNAQTRVSSPSATTVVAVPPARRIAPPPRASATIRYGPIPTRATQRPVAPSRRYYPKSRLLAAALEWLFPGVGVMYADAFWKGALILLSTFIATGVAVSVAMSNANGAQLEDVVDFVVWLFVAHLIWLFLRMIWAWRLAGRATRLARLTS